MTTFTAAPASRDAVDVEQLVADIEQYLAAQPAPAPSSAPVTAHPLVSVSTAELVAEALATLPAAPAPELSPPSPLLRWLPERLWRLVGAARPRRHVTVSAYLHLTALVLERHGWNQGSWRSRGGGRCIAGGMRLLLHLGYGDERTAAAASRAVERVLAADGVTVSFWEWQDRAGVRRERVLAVLREAAA